ncbi:hypothetical protein EV426DRAFT_700132 [Tirmania nivea]|nr:hypothetical protein EV426DRAFT_700132 [Tirmania nivea]
MLAPELVLYGAFRQLWKARLICNKLRKIDLDRKQNVGVLEDEESKPSGGDGQQQHEKVQVEVIPGSAIALAEDKSPEETRREGTQPKEDKRPSRLQRTYKYLFPDSLERAFYLAIGSIEVVYKANPTARRQLTPQGVVKMAHAGLLPTVDIDEINDKSKSDGFARLVVCFDLARDSHPHPRDLRIWDVSLLAKEATNVLVTTIVEIDPEAISLLIDKPEDFANGASPNPRNFYEDTAVNDETDEGSLVDQTETGYLDFTRGELIKLIFSVPICGAYGAIHLLPWNGHFPTNLERIMWRTSGVIIHASPTIVLFIRLALLPFMGPLLRANGVVLFSDEESFNLRRRPTMQQMRGSVSGGLVYMSARLFFIIESFASLRSLPVGAHQTVSWLGMVPHF